MHDEYGFPAACPADRAMSKFLWYDFFHDATLEGIEYGKPDRRDITLTVRIPETLLPPAYRKLCGAYFLRFHGIHHFDDAMGGGLYLTEGIFSTAFVDTPLLHRLQRECAKPLHHLRIRTNCGVMDIVFERFTIRREHGRVDYRCDEQELWYDWDTSMEALGGTIPEENLRASLVALSDMDRLDVLVYRLYRAQKAQDIPEMLTLSRRILTEPLGLCWSPYAAALLGHYGDESDLPALMRLHLHPEASPERRRAALDAMARIAERSAAHA